MVYIVFSSIFFGGLSSLDCGDCIRIRVKAGHAMFMPAGFIHLVTTNEDSVVIDANFMHRSQISLAANMIEQEIQDDVPSGASFPCLDVLATAVLKQSMDEVGLERMTFSATALKESMDKNGEASLTIPEKHVRELWDLVKNNLRSQRFETISPIIKLGPTTLKELRNFAEERAVSRK